MTEEPIAPKKGRRGGPPPFKPIEERLWGRVTKTRRGCWEYPPTQKANGRPNISYKGKYWMVHRLAYRLVHGPIPDGLLVCHHCDNPPCINPEHLFLGTYKDNNVDKVRKGRHAKTRPGLPGTANGGAKLTEEAVREIRALYDLGIPDKATMVLAGHYGVARSTIRGIARRERGRHVA